VSRQHKSSQCRKFEPTKNGTTLARGLPLTTVGGRCGDTGDATSDIRSRLSHRRLQVGKTWTDITPHDAAALEGAGCPAPLANRIQEHRESGLKCRPRVQFEPARGVLARLRSEPSVPAALGSHGVHHRRSS
jgi:hypothetical protein